MNERTKKLLQMILNKKEAWKKSGEINTSFVEDMLYNFQTYAFYDEWYYKKAERFCRFVKALDILPNAEWEIKTFGFEKEQSVWWAYGGRCELDEMFEYVFQEEAEKVWGEYLEIPSVDDILSLGIRPPLVYDKAYEDGSIQVSMFS